MQTGNRLENLRMLNGFSASQLKNLLSTDELTLLRLFEENSQVDALMPEIIRYDYEKILENTYVKLVKSPRSNTEVIIKRS